MCVCVYAQYYPAIKRDETLPFVTDPEGIMLSEVSQTEKDRRLCDFMYM